MAESRFSRTELLLGQDSIQKLSEKRVAVFGIGGVGGYVTEALARSGVGALDLIDKDTVSISNINRQIIALTSTVGKYKTEVMKERILDINPDLQVETYNMFYLPETADQFDFTRYDYVVDAIDTVTGKIALVLHAQRDYQRACQGQQGRGKHQNQVHAGQLGVKRPGSLMLHGGDLLFYSNWII